MTALLQDLRYAARSLFRNPGFSLVAILVLALGIGPNSAIFSIVSAVLLRPLPIKDPSRVVVVWETWKEKGFDQLPVSANNYLDWKQRNHVFEQMGAAFAIPEYGFNVTAGGEPERVPGAKASYEYFRVLGLKPLAGRGFLPEEDRPGGPPVAVVSHRFWQRRLGGDRGVLGQSIIVDGVARTVVGVMPAEFTALGEVDVWIPTAIDPSAEARANRTYGVLARLRGGVPLERAQSEMEDVAKRIAREHPETNDGWGVLVMPIHELYSGRIAPALSILLGAVGLLLLLACANIANLLLARASSRQKEIAIRTAIGARRSRLVRQLMTESVLLALAGGALGLVAAHWCVGLLRGVVPDMLPLMKQMSIDARVILFTFAASVLTGMLFGIAPAWKLSRGDVNEVLKASGRTLTGRDMLRLRGVLLVAEVSLAVVLLIGAGLLARSFIRLMSVDPGLRTDGVLTMQLTLPWARYDTEQKRAEFHRELAHRIEAMPGVHAAGGIHFLPFRGYFMNTRISVWPFVVDGQPPVRPGQEPDADFRIVTPGFFSAMGIPLREGRYFSVRDSREAPAAVIVNEALVRRHFKGRNPIGRRLRVPPDHPGREIIGVVGDAKLYFLDWKAEPAIYVPHAQEPAQVMSLVVHSSRGPGSLVPAIRREVRALDPEQPVSDVKTMASVVADSAMIRRVSVYMLGAFAGLAMVLATVGIYGLTAYTVSQRLQEIGIRMALGAQRRDVLRLVVGRSIGLAVIGAILGILGALVASRIIEGLLFGVGKSDPLVVIGVPLGLLAVAAVASYLPARRAMNIEPVGAVR
jgi:putative ABC transport system permease protein